ncbi:MAG: tRNA uridine-5-carboxymethylaminomethyl(34) synthesis enzyme MnmG [Clostridia bacterium]|nr:tRNA uridine-5-carboxymethylaminomethyl(34) synthesis enzyme MnmG [Clostridia bacterium]
MNIKVDDYDVAVIGGGHAGCEAALATARQGFKTALFVINLDTIAFLACNPSIGGTSKGHLVREVDALGGEMARNADKTTIQSRMLNKSKGPAVHSLRVQADKQRYHNEMKRVLENTENLDVIQAEITRVLEHGGKVSGVVTAMGEEYGARAVVLASGVYMKSQIIIGDYRAQTGPNGFQRAGGISDSLAELGFKLRRFKTGTPARVSKRSVDLSKLEPQYGDEEMIPMSFDNDRLDIPQDLCWMGYTNQTTHDIIRANIHRSPLYSGAIDGIGPRYCPSIEDKVMRFAERKAHQFFLEPEGRYTDEMYVQGISSSLPVDVQRELYRSIKGFENVKIMRYAYAIEYDCLDPQELKLSLETKNVAGFFTCGQINGSSGYEEAAAQGIIAGINAAQYIKQDSPLIISRDEGYVGVLIDDLVTKGTNEPYRMMTSRAEYRLLLRQDNADGRLTEYGRSVGLVSDARYDAFMRKQEAIQREKDRLESTSVNPTAKLNEMLEKLGTTPAKKAVTLAELIRRPELTYKDVTEMFPGEQLSRQAAETVEIDIKYRGYIDMQVKQADKMKDLEERILPDNITYGDISGLRLEARQKLDNVKPRTLGQAMRISGVSPSDISVLMIYLKQNRL